MSDLLRVADLHCDTATALFDRCESLDGRSCHVSRKYFSEFSSYVQVAAVFSEKGLSDGECYRRFFRVTEHFKKTNGVAFCRRYEEVESNVNASRPAFILSLEDARLLDGDLARIDPLIVEGMKIITPLWGGSTCIGGSFDTDEGLTPFGAETVRYAAENGVTADVSHASVKSARMILDECERLGTTAIASHSNSHSIFPHPRNLRDDEAQRVADLGGVIGISFAPQHLGEKNAGITDILRHTDYYLERFGVGAVALGADFDGVSSLPVGIADQSGLAALRDAMLAHGYGDETVDRIFFKNATDLFKRILK